MEPERKETATPKPFPDEVNRSRGRLDANQDYYSVPRGS